MPTLVAAKVALAVLKTRRGRRLLLALLGGVVAAFSIVVIVLISTVNAVVGQCNAQTSAAPPTSGPVYVSQRPSGEALADIPADYLAIYREAGKDTGLDWAVIAAVGKKETDHGRLDAAGVEGGENPSGAGGPMQFLTSTWASVGVDGNGDGVKDRYDPEDAIPSAANYLKLEGAPEDYRSALLAYNNVGWYVDEVLAQAEDYRAAAGQQGDEMASSGALPALATLLSPLAMKPAYAAEGGTVGNPGETSYSSPELETLDLINRYREENDLEPLLLSDQVSTAAAHYAHDMAKYDAYGETEAHVTGSSDYYPEGADLTARMNAEGYDASGYGENIAAGQAGAEEAFEAWRTSPPHNEMMLNPEMRVVGIGLVENPETSNEEFWVTDFGSEVDETARPVARAGSVPLQERRENASGGEAASMAPGPPTAPLSAYCNPFVRAGFVQPVGGLGGLTPGGDPAAAPPTGSGSASGKQVGEEAKKYLGTPYVLGGPEECVPGRQMDCTCLTTTVFRRFGYELPDVPAALVNYGEPVEGEPQAGDVLVWGDPGDGTGGHAAISLGDGQIVHANMGTMDTSVTGMYDSSFYLGARRLVDG